MDKETFEKMNAELSSMLDNIYATIYSYLFNFMQTVVDKIKTILPID